MKIGFLIVGTNKYRNMALDLAKSIQQKFLPELDRKIFVFSDKDVFSSEVDICQYFEIQHEDWPLSSLKRYEYFFENSKFIEECDYLFYLDADLLVVKDISTFDFPSLFSVSHPQNCFFPIWDVETNPLSLAYLNPDVKGHYVQGCFWGGETKQVLQMCLELCRDCKEDLKNGIIAKWFDESHLNRFFFENQEKVAIISSSYAYPEDWNIGIEKLIIHRNKDANALRF